MAELEQWLAEWPAVRASVDELVLSLKRRCVALRRAAVVAGWVR